MSTWETDTCSRGSSSECCSSPLSSVSLGNKDGFREVVGRARGCYSGADNSEESLCWTVAISTALLSPLAFAIALCTYAIAHC